MRQRRAQRACRRIPIIRIDRTHTIRTLIGHTATTRTIHTTHTAIIRMVRTRTALITVIFLVADLRTKRTIFRGSNLELLQERNSATFDGACYDHVEEELLLRMVWDFDRCKLRSHTKSGAS